MLGVTAGLPEFQDLSLGNADQPSNVQAVVDWFGPADFLKMDEQLTETNMAPPRRFLTAEQIPLNHCCLGKKSPKSPT